MNKFSFFCLLLTSLGFVGCNQNQSQKSIDNQNLNEKPESVQCFRALYERDTIDLKINTLKIGKIFGNMTMKLEKYPIKEGEIVGKFRGDTLFVDYFFVEVNKDKQRFKNPLAFLKKDDLLILGNGKITTYLGASYFAKGEPIDFENVKYKFRPLDCSKK